MLTPFNFYSKRNVLIEITLPQTIKNTRIPIENSVESDGKPIDIFFNNLIPCVNGSTFAIFCKIFGKSSNGMVAPDKNNIGKYTRLQTIFAVLIDLQMLANIIPKLYMEPITSK
jgi:hypothetical protein